MQEKTCLTSEMDTQSATKCDETATRRTRASKENVADSVAVKSRTYNSWQAMRLRCLRPNHNRFKWYGARGIKICERWDSYENFVTDMGKRPADTCLDRIDNDGDYTPENCRWTDKITSAENRSNNVFLTFRGVTQTAARWARHLGVNRAVISRRLKRGWPTERALSK